MSNSPANTSKVIKSTKHSTDFLTKLQDLYRGNELSDTTIVAGSDQVTAKAHRIVLSASSDYFLEKFRDSTTEATTGKFELRNVSGSTLRSILDFMYTSEIKLSSDTVENVLRAAELLHMSILITICCDFMIEQLGPCNCLGITLFAENCGFKKLYEKSLAYAAKNFEKVCMEQEFLRLDERHLNKLLSCNDVRIESHKKLFQSLVDWYKFDEASREHLIASLLLQHVRHAFLETNFILENRSKLSNVPKCSELMWSWLEWHLAAEKKKPEDARKILFIYRTVSVYNFHVQTYNIELNEWLKESWPSPSKEKTDYSMFLTNKKFIITGGEIDDSVTNRVECLDLLSKEWYELPSMLTARYNHAMAEINGDLYVVGGLKNGSWLSSVERYDFGTRKWQSLEPLPSAVKYPRTSVLNGLLYVAGEGQYNLQCYDPATNQWTQTASKTERSSNFGMVSLNGHLYTLGGENNLKEKSKTVERYDPSNNTWTMMESLKEERTFISCTAWNDRVYASGGVKDDNKVPCTFEEYNPLTNKWKSLASFLHCGSLNMQSVHLSSL